MKQKKKKGCFSNKCKKNPRYSEISRWAVLSTFGILKLPNSCHILYHLKLSNSCHILYHLKLSNSCHILYHLKLSNSGHILYHYSVLMPFCTCILITEVIKYKITMSIQP